MSAFLQGMIHAAQNTIPRSEGEAHCLATIHRAFVPPVGQTVLEAAPRMAEPFVFDAPPREVLEPRVQRGELSLSIIAAGCRPVCEIMWFEWPTTNFHATPANAHPDYPVGQKIEVNHLGHLCWTEANQLKMIHCVGFNRIQDGKVYAVPLMLTSMPLPPITFSDHGSTVKLLWAESAKRKEVFIAMAQDVLAALFLLCIPRTHSIETTHYSRTERRRALREGIPLIEYKQVKLHVGGQPKADKSTEHRTVELGETYVPRRLHRVIGHFRVYHKGESNQLITFIPEHWRGDASLGIVMHEHQVVNPKEPV